MKTKLVRNYYTVLIEAEAETDLERRFELAILEAKERARIFRIPCQWRLVWTKGDLIRIVREARV
jgi:hypothetical protein